MLLALGLSLVVRQSAPDRKADSISAAVNRKVAAHIAAAAEAQAKTKARAEMALKSVTPEVLASAFTDPKARELLVHARQARLVQDSALLSYDANSYQRVSAWMGFGAITRARLIFRMEQAGQVHWQRDVGVWMDVTGARVALPGIPSEGATEANQEITQESGDMIPVPYYPGPSRSGSDRS